MMVHIHTQCQLSFPSLASINSLQYFFEGLVLLGPKTINRFSSLVKATSFVAINSFALYKRGSSLSGY